MLKFAVMMETKIYRRSKFLFFITFVFYVNVCDVGDINWYKIFIIRLLRRYMSRGVMEQVPWSRSSNLLFGLDQCNFVSYLSLICLCRACAIKNHTHPTKGTHISHKHYFSNSLIQKLEGRDIFSHKKFFPFENHPT